MPEQEYVGFTDDRHKTQVQNAFRDVRTLLGKADAMLQKMITNDANIVRKVEEERFATWFGKPTTANLEYVHDRTHMISRQLSSNDTTLTDDPNSNSETVAYVLLPAMQNLGTQALDYSDAQAPAKVVGLNIHIGKAFYTAPLLGKDSQVGTLIHELSHCVCSTTDVPKPGGMQYPNHDTQTYGEDNCKWLAANHPAQARHNADNYLFYCCSFDLN